MNLAKVLGRVVSISEYPVTLSEAWKAVGKAQATLADGVLSAEMQKRVKDALWNLEKLESVTGLMELLQAGR